MNKLQEELFLMMKDFKLRAEKIDLKYSLYGGTALGGVRHNGFIPWDDDVDFAVDLYNRNKLIDNFEQHFSDKFSLVTEYRGGVCMFMKIHHKELKVTSDQLHTLDNPYLWIDIFTIGTTNKNHVPLLYKMASHIKWAVNFKSDNRKEPVIVLLRKILKIIFPNILTRKIMVYFLKKKNGKNMFMDHASDMRIFQFASFQNLGEVNFEGKDFPIFKEYSRYLSSYFGEDYMTLPPEEDRVTHGLKLRNDEFEK